MVTVTSITSEDILIFIQYLISVTDPRSGSSVRRSKRILRDMLKQCESSPSAVRNRAVEVGLGAALHSFDALIAPDAAFGLTGDPAQNQIRFNALRNYLTPHC